MLVLQEPRADTTQASTRGKGSNGASDVMVSDRHTDVMVSDRHTVTCWNKGEVPRPT